MIKCNLAVLLAERGLKMSDVIKDTGIAKTTVRALYYNSSQGIQFSTLETLCDYLGITPGDLLLYHPFKFTLTKTGENSEHVYFDLELIVRRNKKVLGKVDAWFEVTEWLLDDPNEAPMNIEISIYYSPDVYEELKKVPTLFRSEIESKVVEHVVGTFKKIEPDILHTEVYTDVMDEE